MNEFDTTNERDESLNDQMTDWEKQPSVEDLKADYTNASSYKSTHETRVETWLDNLHVRGKAKPKARPGRSQVVPKLIRKQAEWRYASLSEPFLSSRNIFKAEAVTWEDTKRAQQNGLVLNNQFNTKINKRKFIDDYVRTGTDEGTIVAKVCWEFEEEEYAEKVPLIDFVVDPAMVEVHQQIAQMKQDNPAAYAEKVPEELKQAHDMTIEHEQPIRGDVTGYETQTLIRTVKNQPAIEICSYRDITIDPTAKGDMNKCRFVIHSFSASLDELQRDGRYVNLDKILLKDEGEAILAASDEEAEANNFEFKDKARKQFTVHEYWGYWDIDGTGLVKPIVAAWVGGVFIRLEENPYPHKKIPFVLVQYLPVKDSNFGEPDGELLEDNQKIAGAVTRGMIDLMGRSANGQMGMSKGALDATNKRKYERGQDYEFNPSVDPRSGMYMHTYPEIPASAYNMLTQQNMEAESMTGVKAFSGGLSGEALGEVATGVRGVLDAASKREAGILRRLADGIVEIGRMILSMNAEFLDEEEVVRITNEKFITVRRDDLAGNFDLYLDISTAEEDNAKAQELAFMLQTGAASSSPEEVRLIRAEIARLRKMPELAKKIEEFEPKPDPLQQEIQMLEIEKLKKEIAEIESKTQENFANAQLDIAKARELGSKADLNDLNFVEQESGTQHARDMDRQGAQADANKELKLLDHNLKTRESNLSNFRNYLSKKSSEK